MQRFFVILASIALVSLGFVACSDDKDKDDGNGKVTESQLLSMAEDACKEEVEHAQSDNDPDNDDKTLASCLTEVKTFINEQKTEFPECMDVFLPYMYCVYKYDEDDANTKCPHEISDYVLCMDTNYADDENEDDE